MAIPNQNKQMFLGRVFDENIHSWVFTDGSSPPLPDEMRIDVFNAVDTHAPNGLSVLSTIWDWKARISVKSP